MIGGKVSKVTSRSDCVLVLPSNEAPSPQGSKNLPVPHQSELSRENTYRGVQSRRKNLQPVGFEPATLGLRTHWKFCSPTTRLWESPSAMAENTTIKRKIREFSVKQIPN